MKTKREKRRILVNTYGVVGLVLAVAGIFVSLWFNGLINTGVMEPVIFGVLSWELVVSLLVSFVGIYMFCDSCKVKDRLKSIGKF